MKSPLLATPLLLSELRCPSDIFLHLFLLFDPTPPNKHYHKPLLKKKRTKQHSEQKQNKTNSQRPLAPPFTPTQTAQKYRIDLARRRHLPPIVLRHPPNSLHLKLQSHPTLPVNLQPQKQMPRVAIALSLILLNTKAVGVIQGTRGRDPIWNKLPVLRQAAAAA